MFDVAVSEVWPRVANLLPIANPLFNNQIMEGYSFERILSFLNGLGFNFTNERGLV
jgi:hypothetical protein